MSDSSRTGRGQDEARAAALDALTWLRERFPAARIASAVIPSEEAEIAVRVDVSLVDGPASAAHGLGLSIEHAEDRALVRALEGLGYRPARLAETAPPPRNIAANRPPAEPAPEPIPVRPGDAPAEAPRSANPAPLAGRSAQMGPPVLVRPRSQPPTPVRQQPPAQTRSTLRPVPDPGDDEGQLADVSWTEFWKWARGRGFESREMVNEAIGRSMDGLTPRDVRQMLLRQLGERED